LPRWKQSTPSSAARGAELHDHERGIVPVALRTGASRVDRPHKPHLDEMGIATWHEFAPAKGRAQPRKPTLDEMGPGVEAVPAKPRDASSPRSTLGRPGMRGGWKPRRR